MWQFLNLSLIIANFNQLLQINPVSVDHAARNQSYLNLSTVQIVGDLAIALSYCLLMVTLLYNLRHKPEHNLTRFLWLLMVLLVIFSSFNLVIHITELWQIAQSSFWLIGLMIVIIGITIIATAGVIIPYIPKIANIPDLSQWQETKRRLRREMGEKQIAEAALQESETRFRSIFDYTAMGIIFLDLQGLVIAANPAHQSMIGYSSEEIYGKHFSEYTHSEDIEEDLRSFQGMLEGKYSHYQRSKRYVSKDGQLLWVRLNISLVRDQQNNPQYAIAMVENITERKQAEEELLQTQERLEQLVKARSDQILQMNEELSWQANHDVLTGLYNRYEFERRLAQAVTAIHNQKPQSQLRGVEHTLCYLNLDRFKLINDTLGHLAGDELLRQVSNILQNSCRQSDILARLGGDEFGLIFYQCSLEKAIDLSQSLLQKIQDFQFTWENQKSSIGFSIGLVPINNSSPGSSELLIAADAACYAAKQRGRSRVHVYQPNDAELIQYRSEAQWVGKIEEALSKNLFCLYYQSIAPIQTSHQENHEHYEILIRLLDEHKQIVPPGLFLPAAERYNLMSKIDCWVINNFCSYLQKKLKAESQTSRGIGNSFKRLYTINLSGESINNDELLNFLKNQFQTYQIPTEIICFEITETVAVSNLDRAGQIIQEIRAMGCKIALDDFGSGMSSFGYLKYLPVDYLKIDGSFVKDIVDDPIDYAMVEAINRIGHVMGIETIAEYVANEQILRKIQAIGVDYAQGFGIAKPQPL